MKDEFGFIIAFLEWDREIENTENVSVSLTQLSECLFTGQS